MPAPRRAARRDPFDAKRQGEPDDRDEAETSPKRTPARFVSLRLCDFEFALDVERIESLKKDIPNPSEMTETVGGMQVSSGYCSPSPRASRIRRRSVPELRLWRRGLRRPPVLDSFLESGRGPVDKASHQLARRSSEFLKATINAQKECGRVVEIKCREAVARRPGETEGNQAQTEGKYADDNDVSHVPPLRVPPCDARADHGHSLTNGGRMSTPIAWPGRGAR